MVKQATTATQKRALRVFQLEHRLFQQQERKHYYRRQQLACSDPDNNTSLIIDGMTQATCSIPRKYKYHYTEETLDQKIIGVLIHGKET